MNGGTSGGPVSLRIHLDLILLAARRRQYFTENVEENYLPYWFWRHGDSHNPEIWQSEKCPEMLDLEAARLTFRSRLALLCAGGLAIQHDREGFTLWSSKPFAIILLALRLQR